MGLRICPAAAYLYRNPHFLPTPPRLSSVASLPSTSSPATPRCPLHSPQSRRYAAVRDTESNNPTNDESTPPPWPSSSKPTPYDIFAIARSDPYTKKRFYQLVKLYHPDLTTHHITTLPPSTRLERYRLVIAANDLLSDPSKRHEYDSYGLGWVHSHRPTPRDIDRAWRTKPGSAAANATWEDWERWHEARGNGQYRGPRQDAVYMPNGIFAMLIAMTVIVGAMLQTQRAERSGTYYMEVKAQKDLEVGNDVRRATMASAGMSKDERVGRFLRDRENVAFQYQPGQYDEPLPAKRDQH